MASHHEPPSVVTSQEASLKVEQLSQAVRLAEQSWARLGGDVVGSWETMVRAGYGSSHQSAVNQQMDQQRQSTIIIWTSHFFDYWLIFN